MNKISLFDEEETTSNITEGTNLLVTSSHEDEMMTDISECVESMKLDADLSGDNGGQSHCLCCNYTLRNRDDQLLHYKSDWHRYNIKLKLHNALPITETKFEEILDEISSISGSESEDNSETSSDNDEEKLVKAMDKIQEIKETISLPTADDNKEPDFHKKLPKLYLRNTDNKIISIHKCVLPMTESYRNIDLVSMVLTACRIKKTCVILFSAGHFAAAVFDRNAIRVHKTFHKYIVRAKRGTVQSSRDGQSSSAPKSAGASLRRHNEAALAQDVRNLLNSWKDEHLNECVYIFLHAPHYHKHVLYDGKSAPLERKDPKLRGIPFPTRRPTLKELERVHRELFSLQIHRENCMIELNSRKCKREYVASPKESRTAESTWRFESLVADTENNLVKNISINSEKLRKRKKKNKEPYVASDKEKSQSNEIHKQIPQSDSEKFSEDNFNNNDLLNELFTVCKTGDLVGLKAVVSSINPDVTPMPLNDDHQTENPHGENNRHLKRYLNRPIDCENNTLLHVSARCGHRGVTYHLLELGCDPSVKNKSSKVPYSICADKSTRNAFRRFMADNPDTYDYKTACVPGPLTDEVEKEQKQKRNEKKKNQKAQKKEKQKDVNAEKKTKAKEELERERFASLSDREKRAIAAERRLVQQMTKIQKSNVTGSNSTRRCWSCGDSLLGKIPFEYLEYEFCQMPCLKKHKANAKP